MNIILNTNELGYMPFLHTPATSFIIGLENFCVNQQYCLTIKKLPEAIKQIKEVGKKIYLSINLFAEESDIKRFKSIVSKLKRLDIDAYIVSDLGILNILKSHGLTNKIILDLQTYVTNKYSAKSLLNLGVKRVSLSKEITLDDIIEISTFNNGNIEVLCQGYNPITYSKRSILNCYYKNFKLKKEATLHFVKEESRDNYYYLNETNDSLIVYNDKQYSLFPYLLELITSKVSNFKIDTNFLSEKEINEYISIYGKGIGYVLENKIEEYNKLKEEFMNKYTFDTPFIHNGSFLLKEGN